MTKSELIEILARRQAHLKADDVDLAVKSLLEMMGGSLSAGDRIEIRGFGSFSLHYRPPRLGRNPKTGESVALPGKHVPHFKPGKEDRKSTRLNSSHSQISYAVFCLKKKKNTDLKSPHYGSHATSR